MVMPTFPITAEQVLNLVPTNGIASMYLVSDDPVEHGRFDFVAGQG